MVRTATKSIFLLFLFSSLGTYLTHCMDGTLDATFGTGGVVTTPIGTNAEGRALWIQADGKTVVAGSTRVDGQLRLAITRYTIDGSLDTTFGTNGVVTLDDQIRAIDLTIAQDGKIIVAAGNTIFSDEGIVSSRFVLTRYNTDGSLDATFGINGIAVTTLNDMSAIALQPDGKIVVVGQIATDNPDVSQRVVARFNADGSVDTTFGTQGISISNLNNVSAVALQADGKIIIGGSLVVQTANGPTFAFAVQRLTINGTIDTTFGTNGVSTVAINTQAFIRDLVIQPDGKIVAAGESKIPESVDEDSQSLITHLFTLARFNVDGSLDTSFGVDGIVTTPVGDISSIIYSAALQSDGKIIAAGVAVSQTGTITIDEETVITTQRQFAVARYTTAGALDTSFGTSGIVLTAIGNISAAEQNARVQAAIEQGSDFALIDGDARAFSVGIQQDGKIVVAGGAFTTDHGEFALVRYNSGPVLNGTTITAPPSGARAFVPFTVNGTAQNLSNVGLLANGIFVNGAFTQGATANGQFAIPADALSLGATNLTAVAHYFAGRVNIASTNISITVIPNDCALGRRSLLSQALFAKYC